MEENEFSFKKERTTKRKVVFEREELACPVDSFYIDNKSPLSEAERLLVTFKPVE